jgi:septal ring factor EnvC (AmiA/AmiB activator)
VREQIGGLFVEFESMSPEDMQRTMQFLLRQQAQFAADLAKHQAESAAADARLSAKIDRFSDGLIGLTAIVGQLAASQERAQQRQDELTGNVRDLGDYIKTVDAHLNLVIEMFERHLREDHGQRPS